MLLSRLRYVYDISNAFRFSSSFTRDLMELNYIFCFLLLYLSSGNYSVLAPISTSSTSGPLCVVLASPFFCFSFPSPFAYLKSISLTKRRRFILAKKSRRLKLSCLLAFRSQHLLCTSSMPWERNPSGSTCCQRSIDLARLSCHILVRIDRLFTFDPRVKGRVHKKWKYLVAALALHTAGDRKTVLMLDSVQPCRRLIQSAF